MPVERRWYKFTRENIEKLPKDAIGAYLLGDRNKNAIRPGSSGSRNVGIRGRLLSHLINNQFPSARYFKFACANYLDEARDMERQAFEKNLRKSPKMLKHVKRIPRKRRKTPFD